MTDYRQQYDYGEQGDDGSQGDQYSQTPPGACPRAASQQYAPAQYYSVQQSTPDHPPTPAAYRTATAATFRTDPATDAPSSWPMTANLIVLVLLVGAWGVVRFLRKRRDGSEGW